MKRRSPMTKSSLQSTSSSLSAPDFQSASTIPPPSPPSSSANPRTATTTNDTRHRRRKRIFHHHHHHRHRGQAFMTSCLSRFMGGGGGPPSPPTAAKLSAWDEEENCRTGRDQALSVSRGGGFFSRGGGGGGDSKTTTAATAAAAVRLGQEGDGGPEEQVADDRFNYALLIVLYTLQGIPMGLSASIPFLLQEKIAKLAASAATNAAVASTATTIAAAAAGAAAATSVAAIQASSYHANAIFALCSWPFSLKLLWAPIVDAVYFKRVGRRKSWLVPIQLLAGALLWGGANFVEDQLGLGHLNSGSSSNGVMNVKGVTLYFFALYFLMATQDIAVDGWALTMLSKQNRGKGPMCNSIGQNIGYFLSFVGFLALNDAEASETLWRPLLRLESDPTRGLVSLQGFLKCMGATMLVTTIGVAVWKRELPMANATANSQAKVTVQKKQGDGDAELDAAELGLKETYHRLWAVCQLPSVRLLFLILVTYRLPTALSDNVKFLKAVELGMSKSTTALLSPTVILPLGILVPIAAHHIWHKEGPLRQFATAYQWRVTVIPLLDVLMLHMITISNNHHGWLFWLAVLASTAGQAICNSLQFNAQMIFFASRVDPAIGGTYMTLLNTAANLGGTWPSSAVMGLLGYLTKLRHDSCTAATSNADGDITNFKSSVFCTTDPYFYLQAIFSALGIAWLLYFSPKLKHLASLPDDMWRTHLLDDGNDDQKGIGNRKKFDGDKVDLGDLERGDLSLKPPVARGGSNITKNSNINNSKQA